MSRKDLESEQRLKRRLDEIGQAWRKDDDGPQPPELVDLAVLNRARRAVAPPPWRQPQRWLRGFAATAVVVLAVAVVLQQRPPATTLPEAPPAAPPPNAASPTQAEPAARFEARSAEGTPRSAKFGAVPGSALEDTAERADTLTDGSVDGATGTAGDVASSFDEDRAAVAAAPGSGAAPPGASVSAARERRETQVDAIASRARLEEETLARSAAAAAEPGAAREATEALADEVQPADRQADAPPPTAEEWLARLAELHADGDEAAFQRELERFREAYPEHPLPADWAR